MWDLFNGVLPFFSPTDKWSPLAQSLIVSSLPSLQHHGSGDAGNWGGTRGAGDWGGCGGASDWGGRRREQCWKKGWEAGEGVGDADALWRKMGGGGTSDSIVVWHGCVRWQRGSAWLTCGVGSGASTHTEHGKQMQERAMGVAEPPKINRLECANHRYKATLIQLARTTGVPRVKSRLKPH
jgi:hypothetical protein